MPNFVKTGQSVANILRFFDYSRWRQLPSWIFKIMNFYLLPVSRGPDASLYQTSSQSLVPLWRYCDFSNFLDGRRRHLGFLKSRNFIGYWGGEGRDASRGISMPNLVKIVQSVAKILRFFNFSKWRPPPSWIFEIMNFYLLTVSGGPSHITVPNFIKIGRSFAEILRFVEFSRWPRLPSWIFEIEKSYWLLWFRGWRCISMPSFIKIGQSVAKILRFFDFSRWRPSPSSIFEIVHFHLLTVSGGLSRITVPNIVKKKQSLLCGDVAIRIFKMTAAAILDS